MTESLPRAVLADLGFGLGNAFQDEREREAAYWQGRAELLARSRAGERPDAFWQFEARAYELEIATILEEPTIGDGPSYTERLDARRLSWLDDHGLLSNAERAALTSRTVTVA